MGSKAAPGPDLKRQVIRIDRRVGAELSEMCMEVSAWLPSQVPTAFVPVS
jgi:hypothetical protein